MTITDKGSTTLKVFVTGGTGQIGSNIIALAQDKYDVEIVASLHTRRPEAPWEFETVPMDLEDATAIRRAIKPAKPDVVIHCAVPRDLLRMEFDHDWSWNVLVTATRTIAETCREVDSKPVFVSTDWVFGCQGEPSYGERTPPCPVNYYGVMKVVGETLVTSLCPEAAVARTASVFGPNVACPKRELGIQGTGVGTVVDYALRRLSRGERPLIWAEHVNMLANPSLVFDVAEAILAIALGDHQGTFHCTGRDGVDRFELARTVAEVFGYDPGLVRAATRQEMAREIDIASERPAPFDSRVSVTTTEKRLRRSYLGLRDALTEYRRYLERFGMPT
jgi:dTDP-4-dehydrorhamnose reductase